MYKDAQIFFDHYKIDFKNGEYRIGAFHLHQVTEKAMTAYLLVKTWYKPKTHDLHILYKKIKSENSEFRNIFDLWNQSEMDHFELLRKAYIEARYSKEYGVNRDQAEFLQKRIVQLLEMVERLCLAEIASK